MCRESDDFMPVLFGWYKFVGRLCIFFARLQRESSVARKIIENHTGRAFINSATIQQASGG